MQRAGVFFKSPANGVSAGLAYLGVAYLGVLLYAVLSVHNFVVRMKKMIECLRTRVPST